VRRSNLLANRLTAGKIYRLLDGSRRGRPPLIDMKFGAAVLVSGRDGKLATVTPTELLGLRHYNPRTLKGQSAV